MNDEVQPVNRNHRWSKAPKFVLWAFVCVGLVVLTFSISVFAKRRNALELLQTEGIVVVQTEPPPESTALFLKEQVAPSAVREIMVFGRDGLDSLRAIEQLPERSGLKVSFRDLLPTDIPKIAEYAKLLAMTDSVEVHFVGVQISDDDLFRAGELRDIQSLVAIEIPPPTKGMHAVSDLGISQVTSFKNLKSLIITTGEITDSGVESLAALQNLEELQLCGLPAVSGTGFHQLQQLPIRVLYLAGTNVNDTGIAEIANLKALEVLTLEETQVRRQGILSLRRAQKLRRLYLGMSALKDDDMPAVAELQQLRVLSLVGCNITNASVEQLAKLTQLEELSVGGTRITKAGIARLRAAMPKTTLDR